MTLLISGVVQAQSADKNKVAVCFFWVNMNEDLGIRKSQALYDSVYTHVTNILTAQAGYSFLDKNVLKKKIAFNSLNYPMGSGKKASKSNIAKHYIKLMVNIKPVGFLTSNESSISGGSIGMGKKKTDAKVKITINAVVYDIKGTKIKKVKESAISADKIKITQDVFTIGSVSTSKVNERITKKLGFIAVLDEASLNLAKALK